MLYHAKNETSTVSGMYQGANITYLPVNTLAILDRVLSVSTEVGQFSAVFELLMEWKDDTAYESMLSSTEKYVSNDLPLIGCFNAVTVGEVERASRPWAPKASSLNDSRSASCFLQVPQSDDCNMSENMCNVV